MLEMCTSVYVFYSIRTEARRACSPSSATCFTSGLKMEACFHNGIGRLIFKRESVRGCVCVGQEAIDRVKKQTE